MGDDEPKMDLDGTIDYADDLGMGAVNSREMGMQLRR